MQFSEPSPVAAPFLHSFVVILGSGFDLLVNDLAAQVVAHSQTRLLALDLNRGV